MADYFVTYQIVRDVGNLPKVEQSVIETFFPEAKRDVINRISQETYDEKLALGDTDDDYLRIRTAEARFVLCYLIPAINISSSGDGITKSKGYGDGRIEILSESDVNLAVLRQRELADKILKDYAKTVDVDEDDDNDILITPSVMFACPSDDSV